MCFVRFKNIFVLRHSVISGYHTNGCLIFDKKSITNREKNFSRDLQLIAEKGK